MNFGKDSKITVLSNAVAAGTTDIDSGSIDMQDFENVIFLIQFGAITSGAVTSVKAQQSSDDGSSDSFADLEGTGQTVADTDDDKLFGIEIIRPRERYVKAIVDRATQNAVVESIIAIQYNARKLPTTHDATTVGGFETHDSPAEGTA